MEATAPARILLCHGRDPAEDVRRPLAEAGYAVSCRPPDANLSPNDSQTVVLDGRDREPEALALCRRLRDTGRRVPLLFVLNDASTAARLASLDAGADAYLPRPFAPRELLSQVQALLRVGQLQSRLADKTAEAQLATQGLQKAYRQLDGDREAARRLQRSILPRTLPELPAARLAVYHRPCSAVGGDSYDAFRLDEDHVGFYVADALGHGVSASLVTMFLKERLRPKEVIGSAYRLVPPEEVLRRLNDDLLAQALPEVPFITMLYGLLNCQNGSLRLARAGHPHPIYLPREGPADLWHGTGSLLGVFATEFTVQTRQLRPGDKVLFYTDGVGLAVFDGEDTAADQLVKVIEKHRALPVGPCLERLAADLLQGSSQTDDFTLLGVEMVV